MKNLFLALVAFIGFSSAFAAEYRLATPVTSLTTLSGSIRFDYPAVVVDAYHSNGFMGNASNKRWFIDLKDSDGYRVAVFSQNALIEESDGRCGQICKIYTFNQGMYFDQASNRELPIPSSFFPLTITITGSSKNAATLTFSPANRGR